MLSLCKENCISGENVLGVIFPKINVYWLLNCLVVSLYKCHFSDGLTTVKITE